MAYRMNPRKMLEATGLRLDRPVGPPEGMDVDGNDVVLGPGVECRFMGIPPGSHGFRFCELPVGGGSTLCIISPQSRYHGIDTVRNVMDAVLQRHSTLPDIEYAAPSNPTESDSAYCRWGAQHMKFLTQEMRTWASNYSRIQDSAHYKVWVFYRLADKTDQRAYLCLGQWRVTGFSNNKLALRHVHAPRAAPAPNLALLANASAHLHHALGTEPSDAVQVVHQNAQNARVTGVKRERE